MAFPQGVPPCNIPLVAESYRDYGLALAEKLMQINFIGTGQGKKTISHVLNPLVYAGAIHWSFLQKFCQTQKPILFVGMNPGPYGMAQTGVPFGNVDYVKDWMGLSGNVYTPENEHPDLPITGWDCLESEVSGQRLWNLIQNRCGSAETFFNSCFVHNYCPLLFLSATGSNVALPGLELAYREQLIRACDSNLCDIVRLLNPELIICIGRFAEKRTRLVLQAAGMSGIEVRYIMHPSSANWRAKNGWAPNGTVYRQLNAMPVFMNHFST